MPSGQRQAHLLSAQVLALLPVTCEQSYIAGFWAEQPPQFWASVAPLVVQFPLLSQSSIPVGHVVPDAAAGQFWHVGSAHAVIPSGHMHALFMHEFEAHLTPQSPQLFASVAICVAQAPV